MSSAKRCLCCLNPNVLIMAFMVSVKWRMKCNGEVYRRIIFIDYRVEMEKKGWSYRAVVLIVSVSNYTALTPYDNR